MDNQYASTPIWKLVSGFDDASIPVYYDRQPFQSDDVEASALSFYPRQAASHPQANYQENPLPKDREYDVVGLGIGFATGVIQETPSDSIGLVSAANALWNSRLLLETNQREKLINRHFVELTTPETVGYEVNGSNDGGTDDGFTRKLQLPQMRTLRLPEPIHFDAREFFTIDLRFEDTTGIPAAADWTALGHGPIDILVAMQVVFKDE